MVEMQKLRRNDVHRRQVDCQDARSRDGRRRGLSYKQGYESSLFLNGCQDTHLLRSKECVANKRPYRDLGVLEFQIRRRFYLHPLHKDMRREQDGHWPDKASIVSPIETLEAGQHSSRILYVE